MHMMRIMYHTSQFQCLGLTKISNEMLQDLLYSIYTKNQSWLFGFLFHATLFFPNEFEKITCINNMANILFWKNFTSSTNSEIERSVISLAQNDWLMDVLL